MIHLFTVNILRINEAGAKRIGKELSTVAVEQKKKDEKKAPADELKGRQRIFRVTTFISCSYLESIRDHKIKLLTSLKDDHNRDVALTRSLPANGQSICRFCPLVSRVFTPQKRGTHARAWSSRTKLLRWQSQTKFSAFSAVDTTRTKRCY